MIDGISGQGCFDDRALGPGYPASNEGLDNKPLEGSIRQWENDFYFILLFKCKSKSFLVSGFRVRRPDYRNPLDRINQISRALVLPTSSIDDPIALS